MQTARSFTINLPIGMDVMESGTNEARDNTVPVETQYKKEFVGAAVDSTHKTVLIAEDNESNILTVGDYLESLGHRIAVAHNGLEAVEKAESIRPDVILMDIQMPVMDGLEAISILRSKQHFSTTLIIAITALAMPGDRERCLVAGADVYLSKPVSLKGLANTINSLLPGKMNNEQ